ncbi:MULTISPECIES: hypothetical protein [unclassified Mesorhizobium]|uniref:hypothetical protein n=1 Tax=unclassified Mesorhizobium TaxID=325217 RepID=UPI000FE9CA78|nr:MULTISPECIES: hypothetical protein [unclassified Mesorhizobium]TGU93133.1 hypothetical protein EN794_032235 [Mesorhizobium sp. M00.F.Ca.ET.151.01.1.1]TGV55059.1 hypothetical protein EN784_31805 [bacterium M00.F.Ca.ET.141.01.1.1]RWF47835.1 MAG: hypothetical protein EOS46_11965 [Mesorhizobium sp.]TGQ83872.1 hypothetical protein EN850_03805 [Mesorhizobium sp. M8A.F.Ca.ET.207.01.1.1]TGT44304.1 hypothetical protein EN808_08030 [Mesorhizobium sp. M8A.F.Ca.ET.165.01.1.1]
MTKTWLRHIGLLLPLAAWGLSTQLGQVTPYLDCRQNVSWTAIFCGLLIVFAIAGIVVSRVGLPGLGKTGRFVVDTGFLIALAFLFALALQGTAAMVLDPCQR